MVHDIREGINWTMTADIIGVKISNEWYWTMKPLSYKENDSICCVDKSQNNLCEIQWP